MARRDLGSKSTAATQCRLVGALLAALLLVVASAMPVVAQDAEFRVDDQTGNGIATGEVKDRYATGRAIVTIHNLRRFWVAIEPADHWGSMIFEPAPTTGEHGDLGGAWATIAVIPPRGTAAYDLSVDPRTGGSQSFRVHYDGTSVGGLAATALNVVQLVGYALGGGELKGGSAAVATALQTLTQLPGWADIVRKNQGDAMALTDLPAVVTALLKSKAGRKALRQALGSVGIDVGLPALRKIATGVSAAEVLLFLEDLGDVVGNGQVDGSVAFYALAPEGAGTQVELGGASNLSPMMSGVTDIHAGRTHTCAIAEGLVYCWGSNYSGELGNGTRVSLGSGTRGLQATPTLVSHLTNVSTLDVGGGTWGNSSCAIEDASVWCWGSNRYGQLGDGTTEDRVEPVWVAGIGTASAVTVGGGHACAISDGQAWCWGDNTYGQLGDGTSDGSSMPRPVALPNDIQAISAGYRSTCALSLGRVYCWGDNTFGQLGDGSDQPSLVPVPVVGLDSVTDLSVGGANACAIDGGVLWCWGNGYSGQFPGSDVGSYMPVPIEEVGTATAVSVGDAFICVLEEGRPVCWGAGSFGQMGDGSTDFRSTRTHTPVGIGSVSMISAGQHHACALAGGRAWCWGSDEYGQLGDGSPDGSEQPVEVSGLAHVTMVATGDDHACAVADGGVWCWGDNQYGRLGNGSTTNSAVPVPVSGLANVTAITAGGYHTCAVSQGHVWCWGSNELGQLGDGTTTDTLTPKQVGGLDRATAIAAGGAHTCVIDKGQVWCWGQNSDGQLGDGTTTASIEPVRVKGIANATALGVGWSHSCAVANGRLWCWGQNHAGQLGDGTPALDDGTAEGRPTPTAVKGHLADVAVVDGGDATTCAVAGTRAWCWGSNERSLLGTESEANARRPVEVSSLSAVSTISSSRTLTCAVAGERAWCWGDNWNGSLGDGTTTTRRTPVQVTGLADVTAVEAGAGHACAVAMGRAFCWGSNEFGELGDGSRVWTPVPVIAPSDH